MLKHFTAPRLSTLRQFFLTTSYQDTLGCYAWNQAVAAGLLPLLADVEVSLRNALHGALSRHYSAAESFGWMMPRSNPAHAINPAAPAVLPPVHKLSPKSRADVICAMEKVMGRKPSSYIVTPDDVVAALPFGFWEVLISGLAHRAQPAGLQAAILAEVFPHAPDIARFAYDSPEFRKRVVSLLKRIRDVRNRIGHHDALWTLPEFDRFGVLGFIPRRPRHTVNSLRRLVEHLSWFAGWIDPVISLHLRQSDHWWSLQVLLDRHALAIYRRTGGRAGSYRLVLAQTTVPCEPFSKRRRGPRQSVTSPGWDRYFF
ncbi:Abi family protein [Herbaspirillum huttiense]|uniref:Abi family protein n=2 Tax=Herbaspirillum huttiense TaxID=863372 RepID=A0AAJ2LTU0_9BURK|nr:Abi family protein [Herbaspirillum huttiense]MDR9836660.1 Abi family protein [Herbaspirillum huttiense]